MLGKTQQLTPNMLELMAESEEQQKGLSAIKAVTAKQAIVDGGVSVAVVDENVIQQVTEHHGNTEEMELRLARVETHRRVLAMERQARRRCGRPRGRKVTRSVSRRSQAFRTGRLGSQGAGGVVTCLIEAGRGLRR